MSGRTSESRGANTRRPPRRDWAILAISLSLLAGCSGSHSARKDPSIEPRPSAAPVEGVPGNLARIGEVESMAIVSRVQTAHPIGPYTATIRVDQAAASYGKPARGPMPAGSMIVEALSREQDGPVELYYVMQRMPKGYFAEGGDWDYAVVAPDGTIKAGGKLALCARCHGEAAREHLFEYVTAP